MSNPSPDDVIERRIRIAARPATIFPFLTDPAKMIQWTGGITTLDARPGGIYRVAVANGWTQRGEFIEVIPNERVVYRMGWEDADAPFPPGTTRIEISLIPDGEATILLFRQLGVPDEHRASHGDGWDYFLPRIRAYIETGDAGDNPWASPVLERSIRIAASPEVIFVLLTDARQILGWMGVTATLVPRLGGTYLVNITGQSVVQGEFVEVMPPHRLVHTWGWYDHDGTPPTAWSTVEWRLVPDGEATLVQLRHYCLSDDSRASHAEGWDHYLPRLADRAAGRDPGPDPWATTSTSKE